MPGFTIYGDLNCPFCYALHNQLYQLGLLHLADWRLIEHAPHIALDKETPESQAELASEVFEVRNRAPQVEISLPHFRSESRFASLCIIAASRIAPDKADAVRHQLYQALWVEGDDIADSAVIYRCLEKAGFEQELDISERDEARFRQWQKEWQQGEFSLRIPSIVSPDGEKLLGLPNLDDLLAFFGGKPLAAPQSTLDRCQRIERQTIAVLQLESTRELWPLIDQLRDEFNILLPADFTDLKKQLKDVQIDLILLHGEHHWDELLRYCQQLSIPEYRQIPVALIGQALDDEHELQVYQAGARDYLQQQRKPGLNRFRIQQLMQLKRSQDQLARAASTDSLTQVYNRREFERTLESEWRRCRRSKRPLSLLMIDIDHFKHYNDHYGHLTGDGCLRSVAQSLKDSCKRSQDMVCRYGGEEFALILPETPSAGAEQLASEILHSVRTLALEHQASPMAEIVTLSIGIATIIPTEQGNPHQLLKDADAALYQAKEAGRDRIQVADRKATPANNLPKVDTA